MNIHPLQQASAKAELDSLVKIVDIYFKEKVLPTLVAFTGGNESLMAVASHALLLNSMCVFHENLHVSHEFAHAALKEAVISIIVESEKNEAATN